jgi:hypothetical protein
LEEISAFLSNLLSEIVKCLEVNSLSYVYPFGEFRELWETNPYIIFDTNGFLNIYRYSTETIDQILNVLSVIPREQIMVPSQVFDEYLRNRQNVISTEYSKYREVTKEVSRIMLIAKNEIEKQFTKYNKFRFPLVKELGVKIDEAIESITKESERYRENIKEEIKRNEQMLREDRVHSFVEELIHSGRVGKPFTISSLIKIFSEGEERYKYKIPPGYMDLEKDKNDPTKRDKFGDLIIWKQILEFARDFQSPIIFITNDEKEDWWVLDKNNIPLRPRQELLDEFREYNDKTLAIMNLTNFINHVSTINNMLDHTTYIEMNAEDVCNDLFESVGFEKIIYNEGLLSFLIHGGNLQDFISHPLSDVEVIDHSFPEIKIDTVEINENKVVIDASFKSRIEIVISESYSRHYSENKNATILVTGSISFEFEVDFAKDDDFIKMETLVITAGGFEVLECNPHEDYMGDDSSCIRCDNPNAYYYTVHQEPICEKCSKYYDICPECGALFDHGSLGGSFCRQCERVRVD